ncbi:MAG: disulfide bond formation protein B [Arenicellales bacterium]|nr:disulfide bond formation protein B [Arenicellales bacterium]
MSHRSIYLFGFLGCTALMAIALYFQYVMGLEPCPLCIVQRVFFVVTGLICLVAFIHNPKTWGNKVYGIVGAVSALAGAAVAARHVWLQNLPPELVPECGPGLDYMLRVFPLGQVVEMVFTGSGECAEVAWRFLGLTIPGWTLVVYLVILLVALYQAFRRYPDGQLKV